MQDKKGVSKGFIFFIIGICILFLVLLIVALVCFLKEPKEVINKKENGGNVSLTYTTEDSVFTITNLVPMTDAVALKNTDSSQYFDFTVNTELANAKKIDYEISLKKNNSLSTVNNQDIKIALERQESGSYEVVFGPETYTTLEKDSKLGTKKGNMLLTADRRSNDSTDNYRLRVWLSDTAVTVPGIIQSYSVEVLVNGKAK